MSGPWRDPAEETVDEYPGLVVHDGRQVGAITVGRSRLPLSRAAWHLAKGWCDFSDEYHDGSGLVYGWGDGDVARFLSYLFEHRGEFGRLILTLADVERIEAERAEALADEGHPWLPWWDMPDLAGRVADQLNRCLAAIDEGAS